ncbi:acetyltransferase [Salmonella enterica]
MDYLVSLPGGNLPGINPRAMPWWIKLAQQLSDPEAFSQKKETTPGYIANTAVIDETNGPVIIGDNTRICHGAVLEGPLCIGRDCLVGNNAFIRAGSMLGDRVRIGFSTEVKASIIENNATIGPQCFIADSIVCRSVYMGAMVRTSNHRLDGKNVHVFHEGVLVDSGREKLGCFIGEGASLGVQVIILPGRIVASGTQLAPRIIVERNLPAGQYRLHQELLGIVYPEGKS